MCEKHHSPFTPPLSINIFYWTLSKIRERRICQSYEILSVSPNPCIKVPCQFQHVPLVLMFINLHQNIHKGSSERKVNSHMGRGTFKCKLEPERARVNLNLPHSIWALQGTPKPDLSYAFGKTPDPIQRAQVRIQHIKLVPQFSH